MLPDDGVFHTETYRSSTLSLTLTVDGGVWLPRPRRLSPGKGTRCLFYRTRVSFGNGLDG